MHCQKFQYSSCAVVTKKKWRVTCTVTYNIDFLNKDQRYSATPEFDFKQNYWINQSLSTLSPPLSLSAFFLPCPPPPPGVAAVMLTATSSTQDADGKEPVSSASYCLWSPSGTCYWLAEWPSSNGICKVPALTSQVKVLKGQSEAEKQWFLVF